MLTVEEWARIRELHFAEKMGKKAIARELGISKNTVKKAIASTGPPKYARPKRASAVDPLVPEIHRLLKGTPRMPATVIAERIGWQRGITILKDKVAEIRPFYLEQDPYQRTEYLPGELAQWDIWFPPVDIPVGFDMRARLPVIVGASGYSRWLMGHMIPSREKHDLLGGHLRCLEDLGAVPRLGVYDNEGAIGRNRAGKMEFTEEFTLFKGSLGMSAQILRGGFPEGKGVIERAIHYCETSFLPGRTFSGVDDFNGQFKRWLTEKANVRFHRTLRCRPADRLAEDKGAMLRLPPVLPDPSYRTFTRIGRDHYIRFGTCDYSVHPKAIGRRVEIMVDLDLVRVRCGDEEVARHPRSLVPHRTITDPVHGRARSEMKADHAQPAFGFDEVEVRDLSVYDRVLGVNP